MREDREKELTPFERLICLFKSASVFRAEKKGRAALGCAALPSVIRKFRFVSSRSCKLTGPGSGRQPTRRTLGHSFYYFRCDGRFALNPLLPLKQRAGVSSRRHDHCRSFAHCLVHSVVVGRQWNLEEASILSRWSIQSLANPYD